MRQSNPPITSKQTYQMVTSEMKVNHYTRILFAMRVLDAPSSMQKIAEKAGLDYHAVGRRMGELELEGKVEKKGKGLTERNYPCALYALVKQTSLSQIHLPQNIDNAKQLQLSL
jgi:DNA-binding Lrp family transcriptional regulator